MSEVGNRSNLGCSPPSGEKRRDGDAIKKILLIERIRRGEKGAKSSLNKRSQNEDRGFFLSSLSSPLKPL